MRGFWNDPDGLTTAELTILAVLPLYLFVGVKLALAENLSANQVDFFSVLSYPIIAAIAKQAIERIGWPALGRRGGSPPYQPPYSGYYDSYGYQPPVIPTPTQPTEIAPEPLAEKGREENGQNPSPAQ